MTWVRVDDGFFEHPKTIAAGDDAAYLFLAGLGYCNRRLTDGKIPKDIVPRLTSKRAPFALAARLVTVGYWHDRGDHYESHDYFGWNPSRAQVESRREAERKRKHRGADSARNLSGREPEDDPDSVGPLHSAPLHSSPDGTPPLLPSVAEPPTGGPAANGVGKATKPRTRRIRARLPDEWAPSDEAVAYGRTLGFTDADLERITDEFCTYWWGEGKPKADWDATYQNRLLAIKHGGKR